MNLKEWHKWRSEGIGSSDAAVIMKKFPYGKTPYQLWEERIENKIWEGNVATQHGKDMEPVALKWLEGQIGVSLFSNVPREHNELNWMRATFDGLDLEEKVAAEIKCPFNFDNFQKVKLSREVPEIYYPQLQHQIKVRELNGIYFVCFYEDDGVILEVERDNKYIEKMVKEEEEFWNCLRTKTPPPLTEKDYVELDPLGIEIARQLASAQHIRKQAEKEEEELKKSLISHVQEKSAKGGGVTLTKIVQKGSVDYKLIPELKGIDLEPFRKKPFTKWLVTVSA